jgi:hypothetical protein
MLRMTHETRAHLEAFKAVKVKHPRLAEVDQQGARSQLSGQEVRREEA